MSAAEQMRAMLDQLMGTARNGPGDSQGAALKFDDASVCKSFLCGCCPHEILASTRMDLGECPKVHDVALRADFEQASKNRDYFFDVDACEHLKSFIDDCDRRTELAKKRLAETQEELSAEVSSKAEKVHQLAEEIGKKLADAEQAGAEGKVEESMKLMEEVEEIRKKKTQAELEYRNSMPASSYQQQKLRVCEVCSAYLGIHDNDRRLADHFGGKLHLGFIKIREKLADLLEDYENRKEKRRQARRKEVEKNGHRNSVKEEDERWRRSRSRRTRSRSRDRRRGSSKRSRSRSRSRGKRSRSRDRKKRSRSRDRRRRRYNTSGSEGSRDSRSRSISSDRRRRRRRSRSHSRRSRSRSRD